MPDATSLNSGLPVRAGIREAYDESQDGQIDHATLIERRFRDEVAAFNGTRGKSEIYASLRAVTEYTANEYGNRFLVELVQNGHDAHAAAGAPGEIRCHFVASEGDHGTLYVANQGRPFLQPDFTAICQFARSSKRPGESIGNKGIGFRSVLQVCDYPEVYSADASQSGAAAFRGFCFSFARVEDLDRLISDGALRDAVRRDVPPHVMPVALEVQGEYVRACAAAGFSTVVRLPLKSAEARKDVLEALDALVGGSSPVLLFLEQIRRIRLETTGLLEGDWYCDVSRQRTPTGLASERDTRFDIVEIREHDDDADDVTSRYLLVSTLVTESKMLEVIEASIRADKLPASWRRWSGDGRVALATRLTGESGPGILYNYLPMGADSASPLLGHLDAPFYAKIDRTSLHPSVPLNDFLLDEAARLASRAARVLSQRSEQSYRDAVLDLVAWSQPAHSRLVTAFRESGSSLEALPILPVLGPCGREARGALEDVFQWTRLDLPSLSEGRLVAHAGAQLLPARISGARVQRLEQLKRTLAGRGLTPSTAQLASWVPSVAAHLHATQAPRQSGTRFTATSHRSFASSHGSLRADGSSSMRRIVCCRQAPHRGQ